MRENLKIRVVLTIFLVIVISTLILSTKPYTSFSKNKFDWFWINKTHYSNKAEIIALGDSRVYRGISPSEMNKIIPNKKIINLGYSSLGLSEESLRFASKKLDKVSGKVIVLGVTPYSFTNMARKNDHLKQEINRSVAEKFERKYIYPSLSSFEPIKIIDYFEQNNQVVYYQKFHENGWAESYKIPNNPEEALPLYKKELSSTRVNKQSILETIEFTKKATKKGITIYAFRPPSTIKMEQLEDSLSEFKYPDFIKDFESAGGKWIELPNSSNFQSYDGSHLHYQSAKKLSIILAKKISQP